jgi:flagellar hook-length control protein FliK
VNASVQDSGRKDDVVTNVHQGADEDAVSQQPGGLNQNVTAEATGDASSDVAPDRYEILSASSYVAENDSGGKVDSKDGNRFASGAGHMNDRADSMASASSTHLRSGETFRSETGIRETGNVQSQGQALLDRMEVVRQLEHGITNAVRMRRSSAVLHLDPPELGKVRIHLSVYGGHEVKALFVAEHPDTKHLIESSLGALKVQLADSGYNLGNTNVDVGQHEMFANGNWQQEHRREGRNGASPFHDDEQQSGIDAVEQNRMASLSNSGVYRVM